MSIKTRAFYKDVMGFPIDLDLDNWVNFRVGATLLTLRPRSPGLAWDDGPTAPGSAAVQLAFRVPPAACRMAPPGAVLPRSRGQCRGDPRRDLRWRLSESRHTCYSHRSDTHA